MFEKEAEEWVKKEFPLLDMEHTNLEESITEYRAFKDGAEFGYNKANEWHYPSKGEYPKEDKRYLCRIKTFVGGGISYECFDYDTEYSSWEDVSGEVIAWKEIVLPKESE